MDSLTYIAGRLEKALWEDSTCPLDVAGAQGMSTTMESYFCYYPIVTVVVHAVFVLLILAKHVLALIRPGKGLSLKALAQMHRVAKYISVGCLVLYIVRGVTSSAQTAIVLYCSQAVAWLSIILALEREEALDHAIFRKILECWWLATLGLSSVSFSVAALTGSIMSAGFDFVPLVSSLFLIVISFSGQVYDDNVRKILVSSDDSSSPLLSENDSDSNEIPILDVPQPKILGFSKAGFFGVLTFTWLDPLLTLGNKRPLIIPDVPSLDTVDAPRSNYESFQEEWKRHKVECKPGSVPSMPWTLFKAFWPSFGVTFICLVLSVCGQFVAPVTQNLLLTFMAEEHRTLVAGVSLVLLLVSGKITESIFGHQVNFQSRKLGLRMWSGVGCAVYDKCLRLSLKARQGRSVGEITNIMSADLQRLLDLMFYLQQGLAFPLQLTVAVTVLVNVVGVAMLAGLASLLLVMLVNSFIIKNMRHYRSEVLQCKDGRMRATTECLSNMKVIKLQTWDDMFKERIEEIREEERTWIQKFMYAWGSGIHMIWNGPLLLSGVTFFTMFLLGEPITAARVYTALTTFKIIQEPIRVIPDIIANLIQSTVSMQRIVAFLLEDEVDEDAVERSPVGNSEYAVDIDGAEFTWDRLATESALKNLTLKIKRGSCVAICGAVGSGKSTLLYCIMGELPRLCGTAKLSGRIAYVAQSAWIQNNTVRENILFGLPMDRVRYKEAIRVAGLESDLTQFKDGDDTEIGERGTTLSGGQKQRVQLARAVYQDADVYMLDDPFSAVDAHTGTFLFEECIMGALRGKTIILVTHQVEFLPAVDQIIVMRQGQIVQKGTYTDLVHEGKDLGAFVDALQESLNQVVRGTGTNLALDGDVETIGLLDSITEAGGVSSYTDEAGEFLARGSSSNSIKALTPKASFTSNLESRHSSFSGRAAEVIQGKLIQEEVREIGRVDSKVLWAYLSKFGSGYLWFLVLIPQSLTTLCQTCSDLWLASGLSEDYTITMRFMFIYVLLLIACSTAVLVRTKMVAWIGVATAQKFFTEMLNSIIRAPMSFIDSTPVGRILSRSSTDQSAVDLELPFLVAGVGNNVINVFGTLVITTYVTPQILLLTFPLGWVFWRIQVYYITSSRELSRVTALTEAPLFLHISESVTGAATIRAFQEQPRFADTNVLRLDAYQRAFFHNMSAAEWLGFRLDTLSVIMLSCVAILLITLPPDQIALGLAGMSLSYGLSLSSVLMRLISSASMAENRMVNVERIMQYSNIPSEAPLVIPGRRPAPEWPTAGKIELINLEIRYRPDLPMVLKGVSCVIHPREKVGVVGRTGSGKSTLIQALFRLIEPSGGRILIDGLDTQAMGLHDLRSALGVIPQEPTLFEGSVRTNLDPFNLYNDQQIWDSLDKCQLGHTVKHSKQKLDFPVSEQGENWSVGERQLLCLARALLKHAKILVLDEATASVDISTDAVIQSTINEYFVNCTVISVAHRIPTVIDSDRVLVLDNGHLMENNSPERLLQNENSMFSKLVKEYTNRAESKNNLQGLMNEDKDGSNDNGDS